MEGKDLILAPLALVVIGVVAYLISERKYGGTPYARYYRWGLGAKCLGGLAFGLIYQFYYGGGTPLCSIPIAR